MAGVIGTNAVFKWNSVDLSAGLTDLSFDRSAKTLPSGTFGVTAETFVEGPNTTKLSVKGLFDKNSTAADKAFFDAVGAGSKAFEYYPESSGAGASNIKYSGNAILTKHGNNSNWEKLVEISGEFQVTGAFARATVA